MSENRREQIKTRFLSQDTKTLLDIWQNGRDDEWDEGAFEVVKEILVQRLGFAPPQSNEIVVSKILEQVDDNLNNGELDKAITACQTAIQLMPAAAPAYHSLGKAYDLLGQLENALTNYQKAVRLDPEFQAAWDDLSAVEYELEAAFKESKAKYHLDQALEYAYDDEPELALQECETARQILPELAVAHNQLGLVFQTLSRLEAAMDAYLHAIQLNPRCYAARENLASARVRWEEEQYLRTSNLSTDETGQAYEVNETDEGFHDYLPGKFQAALPGWVYMDAASFLLIGWPGYRTRPGRSGYDPLESSFEDAHMGGVILVKLFGRTLRTRNPFYLAFMTWVGCLLFLPGVFPLVLGNMAAIIFYLMLFSPFSIVGYAVLGNVISSLIIDDSAEDDGDDDDDGDDNGDAFY